MRKRRRKNPANIFTIIILLVCLATCTSVTFAVRESATSAGSPAPVTTVTPAPTQNHPIIIPSPDPTTSASATPGPEAEPEPEPEPQPEPEPEPQPEYFKIAMMGDCTLASEIVFKSSAVSIESIVGDDYKYPFSLIKHLYEDADFSIVNLECAITKTGVPANKSFRFGAVPEYVNILLEGGINFAVLGNNHTLDYGQRGYDETKEILSANGIGFAPNGGWALYKTNTGLTIGVYSKNIASEADVKKATRELREAGAELIIMALHWGDEGAYRPTPSQIQVGRAAIDAGAHIVMGTHSHTLQKVEEYKGGYIYYSLANWIFGGNNNPRDKDTILAIVTVKRDLDGSISVTGAENIPCSISGVTTHNDYRPVPYEEGSDGYLRTISKINGAFTGPDLVVSYAFMQPAETTGQPGAETTDQNETTADEQAEQ